MSSKRILLVDDEPNIRLVLATILENEGYTVSTAEDGFLALREIQRATPDLVLTDLRMPNMDGFELLSILRHRFPELPTVAISGEFFGREVREGMLADAFFQKGSYSLPEFLATISGLLAHKPLRTPVARESSRMWPSLGSASTMLTCNECLRTFPLNLPETSGAAPQTECVFCGTLLNITVVTATAAQA